MAPEQHECVLDSQFTLFSIIFNELLKGQTEGFRAVTKQSLIHALLELNVPTRNTSIDSCMSCYDNLTPFSDVVPLIAELEKTSNLVPVIFSNAEREMIDLKTLNEQSQGFGIFRDVVCVDATPYFKPHPETYHHLAECMSREKSINGISKMWLVSANPFDIVGGMNVGMKTVWIDRKGGGWKDQLVSGDRGMPSKVVRGLEEVVHAIQKYTGVSQE